MTIYNKDRTSSKLYRKIYENNFGPIPKDDSGRSYEIHHIDGNSSNNDPNNLIALSLQEHYDIHYQQGDFRACAIMAGKLNKSHEEISNLIRLSAKKQVENGTHHWLGDKNPIHKKIQNGTSLFHDNQWQKEKTKKQVENGTHPFLGGKIQKDKVNDRIHHFVGDSNPSIRKVKDGTHHLLGGKIQSATNQRLLKEGNHSTQWKWTCECGKNGLGKSNLIQHKRGSKCNLNKK